MQFSRSELLTGKRDRRRRKRPPVRMNYVMDKSQLPKDGPPMGGVASNVSPRGIMESEEGPSGSEDEESEVVEGVEEEGGGGEEAEVGVVEVEQVKEGFLLHEEVSESEFVPEDPWQALWHRARYRGEFLLRTSMEKMLEDVEAAEKAGAAMKLLELRLNAGAGRREGGVVVDDDSEAGDVRALEFPKEEVRKGGMRTLPSVAVELAHRFGDGVKLIRVTRAELDTFPDGFFGSHWGNVETFGVTACGLQVVPKELGEMGSKLVELNLSNNAITHVPSSALLGLTNLKLLNLANNSLSTLPRTIETLSSLTSLSLECNEFTNLPKQIARLGSLTRLNVSRCHLTALPRVISNIPQLSTLIANGNQLPALPKSLCAVATLKQLQLCANRIRTVSPEIMHLSRLEQLWLDHNDILTLPVELKELQPSLRSLRVEFNPIISPPAHVCRAGVHAIVAYFRKVMDDGVDRQKRHIVKMLQDVLAEAAENTVIPPEIFATHVPIRRTPGDHPLTLSAKEQIHNFLATTYRTGIPQSLPLWKRELLRTQLHLPSIDYDPEGLDEEDGGGGEGGEREHEGEGARKGGMEDEESPLDFASLAADLSYLLQPTLVPHFAIHTNHLFDTVIPLVNEARVKRWEAATGYEWTAWDEEQKRRAEEIQKIRMQEGEEDDEGEDGSEEEGGGEGMGDGDGDSRVVGDVGEEGDEDDEDDEDEEMEVEVTMMHSDEGERGEDKSGEEGKEDASDDGSGGADGKEVEDHSDSSVGGRGKKILSLRASVASRGRRMSVMEVDRPILFEFTREEVLTALSFDFDGFGAAGTVVPALSFRTSPPTRPQPLHPTPNTTTAASSSVPSSMSFSQKKVNPWKLRGREADALFGWRRRHCEDSFYSEVAPAICVRMSFVSPEQRLALMGKRQQAAAYAKAEETVAQALREYFKTEEGETLVTQVVQESIEAWKEAATLILRRRERLRVRIAELVTMDKVRRKLLRSRETTAREARAKKRQLKRELATERRPGARKRLRDNIEQIEHFLGFAVPENKRLREMHAKVKDMLRKSRERDGKYEKAEESAARVLGCGPLPSRASEKSRYLYDYLENAVAELKEIVALLARFEAGLRPLSLLRESVKEFEVAERSTMAGVEAERKFALADRVARSWHQKGIRQVFETWKSGAKEAKVARLAAEARAEEDAKLAVAAAAVAEQLKKAERKKWVRKWDEWNDRWFFWHSETGAMRLTMPTDEELEFVDKRGREGEGGGLEDPSTVLLEYGPPMGPMGVDAVLGEGEDQFRPDTSGTTASSAFAFARRGFLDSRATYRPRSGTQRPDEVPALDLTLPMNRPITASTYAEETVATDTPKEKY